MFIEILLTLLSFFSFSATMWLFTLPITFLVMIFPMLDLGFDMRMIFVLPLVFICSCVVYYFQSKRKGYKYERTMKFDVVKIKKYHFFAGLIYLFVPFISTEIPAGLSLIYLPAEYIGRLLNFLLHVENYYFWGALIFIPVLMVIRFLGLFKGRKKAYEMEN